MNSDNDWGLPEDDPHCQVLQASDDQLVMMLHAMGCGWPSVEGGIEVSVEVCSNMGDLAKERTACRCFCIHTDLSF
jgi:hypothetical protein